MKTAFRKSFARDLRKIKDRAVLQRIKETIEDVEAAEKFASIPEISKMRGSHNYYRIRIGDYRIGIALQQNQIEFVRCLHRREIYRFFP